MLALTSKQHIVLGAAAVAGALTIAAGVRAALEADQFVCGPAQLLVTDAAPDDASGLILDLSTGHVLELPSDIYIAAWGKN